MCVCMESGILHDFKAVHMEQGIFRIEEWKVQWLL